MNVFKNTDTLSNDRILAAKLKHPPIALKPKPSKPDTP